MEEQLAAVQFLAQEVGPRGSTSAAEAQAAAYVNACMRRAGLDVEVQTFRAVPSAGLPMGLIYLAVALTPLVYHFSRPAALGLALVGLAAFLLESLSFPVVSALMPWGQSQNVIGTRPASRESCQHLIILAHLDSPRPGLLSHTRLSRGYRLAFLVAGAAAVAMPALAGLGWWLGLAGLWYAQCALAGYVVLMLLLALQGQLLARPLAGANDNASGLAVLLRLAEELQELQQTDLWLVATGSREAGLHGTRRLLRHYPFPRAGTYVVNVDSIGRGELSLVVREGLLWSRRAAPVLLEMARRAESDDITVDADPRVYHLQPSDAYAAMMRGFRALSVMGLEDGRPAQHHWREDAPEHVQPQLLDRATRLVAALARRIDQGVAPADGERPEPGTPQDHQDTRAPG